MLWRMFLLFAVVKSTNIIKFEYIIFYVLLQKKLCVITISAKIFILFNCSIGGSIPIVFSYYSEFLAQEKRGEHLSWLCMFWMIGGIYASAMAWAIIPHYGEKASLTDTLWSRWLVSPNKQCWTRCTVVPGDYCTGSLWAEFRASSLHLKCCLVTFINQLSR